ncbi:hypothetical protein JCM1840_000989 [Sporobolomyces johnsonii]
MKRQRQRAVRLSSSEGVEEWKRQLLSFPVPSAFGSSTDTALTDLSSSAPATTTDSSDLFSPTPWIPLFSSSDAVPTSSDLISSAAGTSGSTAADLTGTGSSSLSASSSAASSSIDELSSPTFGPSVSTVVSAFTTLTVSGTDQPAYTTLFVTATTPSPSPSLQPPTADSGSQLSSSARAGAIAGGVIGGVALLAIALAFLFCLARRRRSTEEDEGEEIRWPEMRDRAAGFYVARTRPTGRAGFGADEEGEEAVARSEEAYVLPRARSTSPFQSLFYHQPAQPGASPVFANIPASAVITHPSTPHTLTSPHLPSSSVGHGTEESTFHEGTERQLLEPEERQQVYSGTGADRWRRKLSVVNKDVDEE